MDIFYLPISIHIMPQPHRGPRLALDLSPYSAIFGKIRLMASQKVINAPRVGAQINDRQCKSLICKESENDTFRFPWSKKSRLDFL
jgi:hypothetical protein